MVRSLRLPSRVSLSSADGRRAHTGRSWCSSPVSSTLEPGVPMDRCLLLVRCGDPNGHSLCRQHSFAHISALRPHNLAPGHHSHLCCTAADLKHTCNVGLNAVV